MIDKKEPIRQRFEDVLRTEGVSSLPKEFCIPVLKMLVTGEEEPDEDAYLAILREFRDGFMSIQRLAKKIGYPKHVTPEQETICRLLNVALQNEYKRVIARK